MISDLDKYKMFLMWEISSLQRSGICVEKIYDRKKRTP